MTSPPGWRNGSPGGAKVLGLNYPSDSVAGKDVAAEVVAAYLACPTVSRLVIAARQEWISFAS